jgi:phage tail-like protein
MTAEEYKTQVFKTAAQWESDLRIDINLHPEIIILKSGGITLAPDEKKGVYKTKTLDSGIMKCQWHRLELTANIPEGCTLEVYYYCSDNMPNKPAEISVREKDESKGETINWTGPAKNPEDMLFKETAGRCLRLKLVLSTGDQTLKPVITVMKLYYPRRLSYMRYLPAVYQEDAAGREFLVRFLSIFQSLMMEIEEKIDKTPLLIDTKKTPLEFLPWLTTWLGTLYDETWREDRWRRFLSRAVELYKKKGTRNGLEEILKIYTDHKPYIIEHIPEDRDCDEKKPVRLVEGDETKYLYGEQLCEQDDPALETGRQYGPCFRVYITWEALEGNSMDTIKRIIREWKPAHTCFGLIVLPPWFCLGMHTYLGVNTILAKPGFILGKSSVIVKDTLYSGERQAGD